MACGAADSAGPAGTAGMVRWDGIQYAGSFGVADSVTGVASVSTAVASVLSVLSIPSTFFFTFSSRPSGSPSPAAAGGSVTEGSSVAGCVVACVAAGTAGSAGTGAAAAASSVPGISSEIPMVSSARLSDTISPAAGEGIVTVGSGSAAGAVACGAAVSAGTAGTARGGGINWAGSLVVEVTVDCAVSASTAAAVSGVVAAVSSVLSILSTFFFTFSSRPSCSLSPAADAGIVTEGSVASAGAVVCVTSAAAASGASAVAAVSPAPAASLAISTGSCASS